ncbi:MAG: Fe-S protein assembly co-chaperone HscB [Acidobacteriia bacterium]|nr:Fe-S protein assembly co-chaperone HscB [Terriglobia bacterium]
MKFYDALGLEPKLALDLDDLKKRFYDRSRQWHPDRFSRANSEEKQRSEEMTSMLNDAFRTLRDPVSRAEYFLRESGLELPKDAPPELLEEVFELNMALEELRGGDESARGQLVSAQERFAAMMGDADASLAGLFAHYDEKPERAMLDQIRATLNRRKYVSNLLRDVEKELNVHSAN